MKIIRFFLAISSLVTIVACSSNSLKDMKWISGTWQSQLGSGAQVDVWTISSDTILGKRYLITYNDTAIMQQMKIYNGVSSLELEISANGAPYQELFECQKINDQSIVFKNVQQTFPELIEISLVRDTLVMYSRGKTQGMMNEAVFAFTSIEPF